MQQPHLEQGQAQIKLCFDPNQIALFYLIPSREASWNWVVRNVILRAERWNCLHDKLRNLLRTRGRHRESAMNQLPGPSSTWDEEGNSANKITFYVHFIWYIIWIFESISLKLTVNDYPAQRFSPPNDSLWFWIKPKNNSNIKELLTKPTIFSYNISSVVASKSKAVEVPIVATDSDVPPTRVEPPESTPNEVTSSIADATRSSYATSEGVGSACSGLG